MSQTLVHWRKMRSLATNGSRSIAREAHSERNENVERVEYVEYRSISAPARISPRGVGESNIIMSADATIRLRTGLYGSVTNAWRGCVVIGRLTPASLATVLT